MLHARHAGLGLLLLALGCQATPLPGAVPSPSPLAGGPVQPAPSGPAGIVSSAPLPTPVPDASLQARAVVVGRVLDDRGTAVAAAQIRVVSTDARFNGTYEAAGGAFGLRDVPVGLDLTVTATAPGFTTRTRTLRVQPPSEDDDSVNRVDFGGSDAGMWYFLSRSPEIARVEPANQARDVKASPLRVTFYFSHAIDVDDRDRLNDLISLKPSYSADEAPLAPGQVHGASTARLEWAEDGTSAVFTYDGAVVARQAGHGFSVGFDPTVPLAGWPRDGEGRVLGMGVAPLTREGSGAAAVDRVAPFARGVMDEPRPSTRPSPLALWGATHHTTARFELARDLSPLKVISVEHIAASGGKAGGFLVTFNKPVWGYPASALSPETTTATNFRSVVGSVAVDDDREAFQAADPRTGSAPGLGVEYEPRFPTHLILREPARRFEGKTRFKIFIGPKVEDVHGVALGGEGTVIEGNL